MLLVRRDDCEIWRGDGVIGLNSWNDRLVFGAGFGCHGFGRVGKEVSGLYKKEFVDVLMCVMCRAFCSGQEQDTKMTALLCLCGCSTGFGNGSCKMWSWQVEVNGKRGSKSLGRAK